MENKEYNKFERAQHRVARIKGFHRHVGVFVVINAVLLLLKDKMAVAFLGENALAYPEAMNWIYWNVCVWLVILAIHALLVFGNVPFFVKKWEERQINKYLDEDIKKSEKYK